MSLEFLLGGGLGLEWKGTTNDSITMLLTTKMGGLQDYDEVTLELLSLRGWNQGETLFPESLNTAVMTIADRIHTRQSQLGSHPVVMLVG